MTTPTPDMLDEKAIDNFYRLTAKEKKVVWRRVRDAGNKNGAIRDELVQTAILGGIAPSILKGMGDYL